MFFLMKQKIHEMRGNYPGTPIILAKPPPHNDHSRNTQHTTFEHILLYIILLKNSLPLKFNKVTFRRNFETPFATYFIVIIYLTERK